MFLHLVVVVLPPSDPFFKPPVWSEMPFIPTRLSTPPGLCVDPYVTPVLCVFLVFRPTPFPSGSQLFHFGTPQLLVNSFHFLAILYPIWGESP